MQVGFAVLADAASATQDGKFSILGGDLGSVSAPSYPALHSVLALVVKLQGTREEVGTEHVFRIEIRAPDGSLVVEHTQPFVLQVPANGNTTYSSAGFVMNLIGLILPLPGMYTVHLIADDEEVGTLSFQAQQVALNTSDEADESDTDDGDDNEGNEAE